MCLAVCTKGSAKNRGCRGDHAWSLSENSSVRQSLFAVEGRIHVDGGGRTARFWRVVVFEGLRDIHRRPLRILLAMRRDQPCEIRQGGKGRGSLLRHRKTLQVFTRTFRLRE